MSQLFSAFLLFFLCLFSADLLASGCKTCKGKRTTCATDNWDYIIIGNGTAGAVLARELSNNKKNKVLVLEWGQNRSDDPVVLSPDVLKFANTLTYDPLYAINLVVPVQFSPMPEQQFNYSEGVMWGGSSGHNGLFAVRGTPRLYDSWAAITRKAQWSYNNLLPLMLDMEHYTPDGTVADPNQRGSDGPLFITQSPPVNNNPFAIAQATATSAPFVTDYNNPTLGNIGTAAHQAFVTPGLNSHRSFSVNAYTPIGKIIDEDGKGLHGRKLRIVSNALVSKVLFKHKTAIGVEYYLSGDPSKVIRVYAKKKIILCAGTTGSSTILERSGIGDKKLLSNLGIKVIVNNPNVGEHLQNHYGVLGVIAGTTTFSPVLDGFINMTPYAPDDDVRRVQVTSLFVDGIGIAVSGLILDPHSRGSVHIVDKNPTIYPRMNLNMFSDGPVTTFGTDSYYAASFYKIVQNIAANFGQPVISPPASVYAGGDSALLAYGQTLPNLFISYHAVGTARMGRCIKDSVVNGNLHVLGVKKLMVADVSIEPIIADGNTAYAAYLIGMMAANIIKSDKH